MIAVIFCAYFAYVGECHCPRGYIEECIKPKPIDDRSNANFMYYHEGTFGIDFKRGYDPCKIIKSNENYKNLMNKYINCIGKHCIDNKFKCNSGDSRYCYNVEHIFDKKGCRYRGDDALVMANLVMAYGKWNQDISHKRLGSCAAAEAEKEKVYGKEMMDRVRNQINLCRNKRRAESNTTGVEDPILIDESDDDTINGFDYGDCDKSCTCESNKYLDVLCGCDYSETEFDPSCQTLTHAQIQSKLEFYRGSLISSSIFLITVVLLLIASLVIVIRGKNKEFDIPPEFNV